MEREELLKREDEAWGAFMEAVAGVPGARRGEPGVVPGWSTQDLYWHCGYWTGYIADTVEGLARGEGMPADHSDEFWDGANDAVAREAKWMTWEEIERRSAQNRARARAGLESLSEIPAEAAEEFASETFEHYDEHAVEITKFAG